MPPALAGHCEISSVELSTQSEVAEAGTPANVLNCVLLCRMISPVPAEIVRRAFDMVEISVVALAKTSPVDPMVLFDNVCA